MLITQSLQSKTNALFISYRCFFRGHFQLQEHFFAESFHKMLLVFPVFLQYNQSMEYTP